MLAAVLAAAVIHWPPFTVTGKDYSGMHPVPEHFYPDGALARRVEGKVILDCLLSRKTGTVSACKIGLERPRGEQFGAQARKIVTHIKVSPEALEQLKPAFGTSTTADVEIPVYFVME